MIRERGESKYDNKRERTHKRMMRERRQENDERERGDRKHDDKREIRQKRTKRERR